MAVQPNNDEAIEEREPYKMSTIARLTRFSPILLRAWERRYKLLMPARGPGGHRLYTEDDRSVLRRVRQLIDSGRSIGEIAGMGREALLHQQQSSPVNDAEPDGHRDLETHSSEAPGMFADWRKRIVQAALAMEEPTLRAVLDESFAAVSPQSVIDGLIVPSAREIGDLWMAGRCTVASEHMATAVFRHRVRKLIESAGTLAQNSPAVLGACFPEENHELGLLIFSYHLVRRGVTVGFLGAALPFEDLDRACEVMQPSVALLSVTRSSLYSAHKPGLLTFLEHQKEQRLVCVGGAGVPEQDTDVEGAGARLFPLSIDLKDAVEQVEASAGTAGKVRRVGPGRRTRGRD